MNSINPTPEQLKAFLEQVPDTGALVMINLLKFRAEADYPSESDHSPCTGQQAYERYSKVALEKVKSVGGQPLWLGQVLTSLIGPQDETWDQAILVQYPSKSAFLTMLNQPDYKAATIHRTAALENSRLIATSTLMGLQAAPPGK